MKRLVACAVLFGAALLPATADAGLVYVKAGNIWSAKTDGSRAHRVTRNGTRRLPYDHPTQADSGTIVALRGTDMFRFTPGGRRVGKPRRVSAGLSRPGSLHELAEASEVSPNGKRVALQKTLLQGTYDPNLGRRGMTILSVTVEYRNASTGKRQREVHQPGDYYQSPSWVGNNRLLIFAPFNSYAPEVFVDTLGGPRTAGSRTSTAAIRIRSPASRSTTASSREPATRSPSCAARTSRATRTRCSSRWTP